MKKELIGICVCVLLVGSVVPVTATLITDKTPLSLNSGNILYVGGDGEGNYTKIQDAINDSSDGDTVFVYDDSSPYYENVVLDKSINLIGENKDTTIIDGNHSGDVIYVSDDMVTISGFTIQNCGDIYYAGIKIVSIYNTITGNTISNNLQGIYLITANSNTITGNTISNNKAIGISFFESNTNTITGNTISNNDNGIIISHSSFNTVLSNIISSNNAYGVYLYHTWSKSLWPNILTSRSNTILKNNFLDNGLDAVISNSFSNQWKQNYWNKPRFLPKIIIGKFSLFNIDIPWFSIDWEPASEPYDIGI